MAFIKKFEITKSFLEQRYLVEKKTQQEIAEEVGCTNYNISLWMRKYKIPTRTAGEVVKERGLLSGEKSPSFGKSSNPNIYNITKDKLYDLYWNKGKDLEEISKYFGCSISAIYRHFQKHKLKTRGRGLPGERHPFFGRRGTKSHLWKGGQKEDLNIILRKYAQYIEWRNNVYKRDNYVCVQCGYDKGGILEADHIVPFSHLIKENNIASVEQALECSALWDISNGRTLCKFCHEKTDTWGSKARKFEKK